MDYKVASINIKHVLFIKKAIDLYEKFLKILTNPMKKLTFGWRYTEEKQGTKKA